MLKGILLKQSLPWFFLYRSPNPNPLTYYNVKFPASFWQTSWQYMSTVFHLITTFPSHKRWGPLSLDHYHLCLSTVGAQKIICGISGWPSHGTINSALSCRTEIIESWTGHHKFPEEVLLSKALCRTTECGERQDRTRAGGKPGHYLCWVSTLTAEGWFAQ